MKGSLHGRAVLTDAAVRWIRANYVPGNKGGRPETTESATSLHGMARRFGVSHRTILRVLNRETWGHIA